MNKNILKLLEDRIELGKRQYPEELDVNDGRDWHQEALEEILDALIYIAAKLLQLKEKSNGNRN